jgi:large-conductance mechanosensitive channel
MMQEIITYLIIAVAIFLAVLKLKERFLKKKTKENCTEPGTLKTTGCGGCGASCPVRQAPFKS